MHRNPRTAAIASLTALLTAATVYVAPALAAEPTVVVSAGDTLTAIARRTGTTIADLVAINHLADPNRIYAGQTLALARGAANSPSSISQPQGSAKQTYRVRPGDNLTVIAARTGTTIPALVKANRIANPSRIYAGQTLVIPGQPSAPAGTPPRPAKAAGAGNTSAAQPSAARTYIVRAGDTLTAIAGRTGATVDALAKANRIANPSRIYAGQALVIPGSVSRASARPSAPPMPARMAATVAERADVRALIAREARRYGVPVPFALAVSWQESGWQHRVVSSAGAVGAMQLLPATADWVGEAMLGTTIDLRNPRHNVRAGVRLLAHYLDRYDGNIDLVLAAYYQGQTATDRYGVFPITRPYIASIRLLTRQFGG